MSKIFKSYPMAVIGIIIGAILAASPFGLFHICTKLRPDGGPMMCHYTGKFLVVMGIVLVVVNVIVILAKKKSIANLGNILTLASGVLVYAIPNRIIKIGDKMTDGWQVSYCMKDTMMCINKTKPAVNLIAALIIVIALIGIIQQFLVKEA